MELGEITTILSANIFINNDVQLRYYCVANQLFRLNKQLWHFLILFVSQ